MNRRRLLLVVLFAALASGCAGSARTVERETNALAYLYPAGSPGRPGEEITLQLPLRLAVAFAPGESEIPEALEMELLERVAESFRDRPFLERIEVLPTHYLNSGGSFEELDALAKMLGFTEVVLVSYHQHQFSASGTSSWTYWTIVGAAVVQGEKNETKTVLDAVVFDIPSRSLLLRAAGKSSVRGKAHLLTVDKKLAADSDSGFRLAAADLVRNLETALEAFERQAVNGTVRGAGTPAVSVFDAESGRPVQVKNDGSGFDWGGALGLGQVAAIFATLGLAVSGMGFARSGRRR